MDEQDMRARPPEQAPAIAHDVPVELQAAARDYARYPVPSPTAEDTSRLLVRLLAEVSVAPHQVSPRPIAIPLVLRVARWRMRVLGVWFWVGSVLLLAFAAALTSSLPPGQGALPLVCIAPLTVVLGLTHALQRSASGLRDVEASCPVGFIPVTSGLALAIVTYDVAFGVLATVALALLKWAPFVALLAAWLGPLLMLAGISLPIALRWGTRAAMALGGGPWLVLAALAWLDPQAASAQLFTLPHSALSLTLHLAAALLGSLLLVLLLVRGSRWQPAALLPAGEAAHFSGS